MTAPQLLPRTTRRRTVAGVLLAPVLAGALLAGCGGDEEVAMSARSEDSAGSGGGVASRDLERPADGSGPQVGAGGSAGTDDAASGREDRTDARVLPTGRDIVYRGQITVRVRDVGRASSRAEALALEVDGVVFSEQTSAGPGRRGGGEATLTLRVPPAQFASTLDSLGRLGRELSRSRSAQDVTTELTDVDSRVRSQERSVARIRSLLAEADTIGEVVQIESELARREADLESLQAQLARLRDVTDLATIDVTFLARGTDPRPVPDEDDLGFAAGLRGGWDALVSIALVTLTVLGALLPFLVTAALLGLPAYALLRARRRGTPTPSGPAPEPTP